MEERTLFILVHGNNGTGADWDPLVARARSRGFEGHFLQSIVFEEKKTRVGVEKLGVQLAEEVGEYVERNLTETRRISVYFIAHSLGGLVCRAALPGILQLDERIVLKGLLTICSPHLGVCRPGGGVFKFFWKHATEGVCRHWYGQTGQDLTFHSHAEGKFVVRGSLLQRLADPEGEFMQALSQVEARTLIASPFYDMVVPYCTASGSPHHPYNAEESDENALLQVWGFSGFENALHQKLIEPLAHSNACGRPDVILQDPEELEESGWQSDHHRFLKYPVSVASDFNSLSYRRLDVSIQVHSRWQVHDSYLKKALAGIVPASSDEAADAFHDLLIEILRIDLQ